MKKNLLFAVVLSTVVSVVFSQNPRVSCGFSQVRNYMMATDSEFRYQVLHEAEEMQAIRNAGILTQPQSSSRSVSTIPVVVHVVLTAAKQSTVTDAMIYNLIVDANEHLRKQTADTNGIRAAFKSLATDCRFELCLAQRDPNGNPTTGIDRVNTTTDCFSFNTNPDDMKRTTTGGTNAWTPSQYYNIWICDLCEATNTSGGVGGYSQNPYSGVVGAWYDGTVIEYQVGFWDPGVVLAHETGHYMGLHHTWGDDDGGSACGNVFPNTDDGFNDTPDSKQSNINLSSANCGSTVNSCNTAAPGDQYENIMDYGDCTVMFTPEQSNLMNLILSGTQATINGTYADNGSHSNQYNFNHYATRASLIAPTNMACVAPNGPTANFTATPNPACVGQTVTYTNTSTGVGSGSNVHYSWSFPNGTPATSASDSTVTVTYSTTGTFSASLSVTSAASLADDTTRTTAITILGGAALPVLETFEGTFPPTNWSILNPNYDTTWVQASPPNGPSATGTHSAFMNIFGYATANLPVAVFQNSKDWLITPPYDLTSATAPKIKFDYAYQQVGYTYGGVQPMDTLQVLYSLDCGSSWTSIWKKGGTQLLTSNGVSTGSGFVPTAASQWKKDSVTTLPASSNVRFAFVAISNGGNNIYLDNVNVYGNPPTVPPVAHFSANDTTVCTGTTVTFTDQSTNVPNAWNWTFTGGSPATSVAQNPTVTYAASGTYTVKLRVANANGADSLTKTAYIVVSNAPTAATTVTNVNCFGGATGSATVNVSGGTAGYTYVWSGGGNTATISNKTAANYTVTVTDANGCSVSATAAISQPTAALAVSVAATNIGCGANGTATANATGGTTSYAYLWNNSGGTNQSVSGITTANTYTVTVTDANGCTAQSSAAVTQSNSLNATATAVNASCGNSNGRVYVTPSLAGGTFVWSPSGSGDTLTGLGAGNYSVTVTVGSCSATATATVLQGGNVALTTSSTAATNGQPNGSASVTATGGAGSYSYAWNNSAQTATASGVAAGSYSVTVTDVNGCSASATVTVQASSCSITANATAVNASCGNNNGSVSATTNAASPQFEWNNNAATATVGNLGAGTYTVTVTSGGCTATASATVIQSGGNGLSVTTATVSSTNGQPNGSAYVTATDGTLPYSYHWSTGDSTATIADLTAGTYQCTISDANGCSVTVSITVNGQTVGIDDLSGIKLLELYPNPASDHIELHIEFNQQTAFSYNVSDALGRTVYQSAAYTEKMHSTAISVGGWAAGVYILQLKTATSSEALRFIKQ